jgi:hypothetical protein
MESFVEVSLDNGTTVLFEQQEADGAQAFTADGVVAKAEASLGAALDVIVEMAETIGAR